MPRKKTPAKSLLSAQPLRLEWLDPIDLESNPRNWREHPAAQKQALAGAIEEVGWAGALLFNETTGRLIDGHARKELFAGKSLVPVLVGRWTEGQEKVILASLDPLSAMASLNKEKLESLIQETQAKHAAVREMLSTLVSRHGLACPCQGQMPIFFHFFLNPATACYTES